MIFSQGSFKETHRISGDLRGSLCKAPLKELYRISTSYTTKMSTAPQHTESDPTRAKCGEACSSKIRRSTAPQREQSDTCKVTKGLSKQAYARISPCIARPLKVENVKHYVLPWFQTLFHPALSSSAAARKNEPGESKELHLPNKMTTGYEIQK
jgi:hypothetical protein